MDMREFYTSSLFLTPRGVFTCKGGTQEFSVAVASRFAGLLPDFKCPKTCRDDDPEFIALCNEFSYICLSIEFSEHARKSLDETKKWIVPADLLRAFANFETWDDDVKRHLKGVMKAHEILAHVFDVDSVLFSLRKPGNLKAIASEVSSCIQSRFVKDFMDTSPPVLLDSIRKTRLSMSTRFEVLEPRHHVIQGLALRLCKFVKVNLLASSSVYKTSFAEFLASDDFLVKMYLAHIREHGL